MRAWQSRKLWNFMKIINDCTIFEFIADIKEIATRSEQNENFYKSMSF
jgi:hypothetical protein